MLLTATQFLSLGLLCVDISRLNINHFSVCHLKCPYKLFPFYFSFCKFPGFRFVLVQLLTAGSSLPCVFFKSLDVRFKEILDAGSSSSLLFSIIIIFGLLDCIWFQNTRIILPFLPVERSDHFRFG